LTLGELDAVPFAEIFERAVASVAVEEEIISLGFDEAEAFFCDDFFDSSLRHVISMDWYFLTLLTPFWSSIAAATLIPVTAKSLSYFHRSLESADSQVREGASRFANFQERAEAEPGRRSNFLSTNRIISTQDAPIGQEAILLRARLLSFGLR
jgi:hypothetical protein